MTKLTIESKKAILKLHSQGHSCSSIVQQLHCEYSISVSRQTVNRFLLHYKISMSLTRRMGSGRPSKITPDVLRVVEAKMQADDETTVVQFLDLLRRSGIPISLSTVKRCRFSLGWTFHGTRYCQMIREPNKLKRLDFANKCLAENENFDDVIWTDETSVQLECHHRHCFRKRNQKPRLKPRPKHPIKVHVWAGISKRGATQVCIFEGKMDAPFYVEILSHYLVPFIQSEFPSTHRLMQDNDPKHTSRLSRQFFEQNEINWWKTPPESPDMNPIENVWHELKEFIRRETKPKSKQQLIDGIQQFWSQMTEEKCRRYINHIHSDPQSDREFWKCYRLLILLTLLSLNINKYCKLKWTHSFMYMYKPCLICIGRENIKCVVSVFVCVWLCACV